MTRSPIAAALAVCAASIAGAWSCRNHGEPTARPAVFPVASASARAPAATTIVATIASAAAPTPTASSQPASSAAALSQLMACAEPRAQITNLPTGGTVFNNAMTSSEAGHLDRAQGILDAIGARSQAMRCCFEPWLSSGATRGRVLLRVVLDPGGVATAAEIDANRSDVRDPTTLACLTALAKSIVYPPSPAHRETTVEYPIAVQR